MKKIILTSIFFISSVLAVVAFAEDTKIISAKHAENDLTCQDCHETANPEKRASAKSCIQCHGDIPGDIKEYHDNGKPLQVNPHDSHQGALRCTLCHSSHGQSKLYCLECHTFEDMKIK